MKSRTITCALLLAALLSGNAFAQKALPGGNNTISFERGGGRGSVPTNSPEPLTLIALASGAAVAGGAAVRRKRRRQS